MQNPAFESFQNTAARPNYVYTSLDEISPHQIQNPQAPSASTSGNVTFQKNGGFKTEAQHEDLWQNLIDWVNSFDDPNCLLVSSFDDLKDGIALCHLVGLIVCNESDCEQMKQLIHYEGINFELDETKQIQNLDLALNVLKASTVAIPDSVQNGMTAEDLHTDPLKCYMFIETLRQAKNLGIMAKNDQMQPE